MPAAAATPNPKALTPRELAEMLTRAGADTTPDDIAADIAEGAPTNEDGTLHFTHYVAWLVGT